MDPNKTPNAETCDAIATNFRTQAAQLAALAASQGMAGAVDGTIANYLTQAEVLENMAHILRGESSTLKAAA